MASPLPSRKSSVDLTAPAVRVSRIRRDPPPKAKEVSAVDVEERESRAMVVGVVVMALALVVAFAGVTGIAGWSPVPRTIYIKLR